MFLPLTAVIVVIIISIFIRRSLEENSKLAGEVDEIKIIGDPNELINLGYRPLINILNQTNSMLDPRPGAVIQQYRKKGYELAICPVAYQKNGSRSYICRSLWGKYKLHVI